MYSLQEQFKSDALAQLNSKVREAQAIAGNILEVSRDIGVLNVRATKASAEALASTAQKMLSASNPVEFFQLAVSAMRPDMQAWTSYAEQLRSIAGKMSAPLAPLKTSVTSAPFAAAQSTVTWPEPAPATQSAQQEPAREGEIAEEAIVAEAVVPQSAPSEPVASELVIAESAVGESVLAESIPPRVVVEEPAAGKKPAPAEAAPAKQDEPALAENAEQQEVPEGIQEVADAIVGVNKAPPVVMAASAPQPNTAAMPKATIARPLSKTAAKAASRKINAAAPSPGAGRAKKN